MLGDRRIRRSPRSRCSWSTAERARRRGVPYPTYTPTDPTAVVAQVPPRDPREVAMRAALRAQPGSRRARGRSSRASTSSARASLSDPRYLGRAQATLARWCDLPQPPPDVLLLRATIRQSLHDFTGARADLDRLIARRPRDAQAHLTRAVVATDHRPTTPPRATAARGRAARRRRSIAATCIAPIDGVTGHAHRRVRPRSTAALDATPRRRARRCATWAITALAELAIMTRRRRDRATQLSRGRSRSIPTTRTRAPASPTC